jgi:pimeloyl-ACP methyl ester carboxylesterase
MCTMTSDLNGQAIVLVHGAWHGGWCWRDVADRLGARGARVFCPTMTGLGDRRHLRAAYKGLETFIEDVTGVIEREELTGVTLVGHSFGGMVVTGVADRLQDRIKHIVYLDAAVPADGHSMVAMPDTPPEAVAGTIAGLKALTADGEWMAPIPLDTLGLAGAPEALRARVARGMTEHPLSSWTDALHFKNGGPKVPRTYIFCNNPVMPQTSFPKHYENAKSGRYGPDWTAHTLATGHEAMFTMPAETAEIIASAALAS